jgi:hypothetical protein
MILKKEDMRFRIETRKWDDDCLYIKHLGTPWRLFGENWMESGKQRHMYRNNYQEAFVYICKAKPTELLYCLLDNSICFKPVRRMLK